MLISKTRVAIASQDENDNQTLTKVKCPVNAGHFLF